MSCCQGQVADFPVPVEVHGACPGCGAYVGPGSDYYCQNCGRYAVHNTPDWGSFAFGGIAGLIGGFLIWTELGKRIAADAMHVTKKELDRQISKFETQYRR